MSKTTTESRRTLLAALAAGLLFAACRSAGGPVPPTAALAPRPVPPLPPPAERRLVAVAGFQNRSSYASDKLWDTSSQLLSTQLIQAGYFRVVEWERMKQIFDRKALSTLAIVTSAEGRDEARKVLLCEYFLSGAVTRFDVSQTAQVSAMSKRKTFTTAVRVDLQLQDATTGEYLAAASAEAAERQEFAKGALGTWEPAAADRALERAIADALALLTSRFAAATARP